MRWGANLELEKTNPGHDHVRPLGQEHGWKASIVQMVRAKHIDMEGSRFYLFYRDCWIPRLTTVLRRTLKI
ncbi:hypothetical protein Naga_100185g2 [Nannochloropsis gaditana]|uniref:Uncharacterized protein n=1 Tax=Nannochloropsis gaditana TaxID=72520 RepID=W7U3D8_9STRA|nr:hypothetical protein Naga_100185g2 [Nannochloropsis gaditana]